MNTNKFDQKVYDSLSISKPEIAELYKARHKLSKEQTYDYIEDTSSDFFSLPQEWRDHMYSKYAISQCKDGYVVESPFIAKAWPFSSLDEAERKIRQLVVWLYGERKRGCGDVKEDMLS